MTECLRCICRRLPWFAAALWWGALSALGLLAVPLVLVHAPSPAVAGRIAAELFSAMNWLAVACALVLVVVFKPARDGEDAARPRVLLLTPAQALTLTGWALAGAILALLLEFGVAPRIVLREGWFLWHSIGVGLYALQWLCASAVLWWLSGSPACCHRD